MGKFKGFPKDTLRFLNELEQNNSREWFNDNKERYESLVREPSLDFITAMGPELAKISDHFIAIPKKVGGSLMRVYRDTRFGKDKTPYKTNIGIQFRHEQGKDVHAPGYYLHIGNDSCYIGVGAWHPEPESLQKIRERIINQSAEWKKARNAKAFKSTFELGGDSLKRAPRGIDEKHPLIEDLKRRDFIAVMNFDGKEIQSERLVKQVARTFSQATPFMQFLCRAMEVNF